MIKSCYIHIPFCESICSYCDFCKIIYKEEVVDRYLNTLEEEVNTIYKGEKLDTIYIGGGTPSSLNIRQLKRLFKILNKLNKSNNLEYTIECNFQSVTKEKLELFKEYGINRLSLGIESINKDNLLFLERDLDLGEVESKISLMRKLGFNNINLDLMYALKNETITILDKDISYILSLDVEHISTYSLIIEEHTKLGINKEQNIKEDIDYKMYNHIVNRLKDNGYNHYEISNFAKKGYESNHNKTYWLNNEYYGFGLGAASYLNNKRINNTKSITKYLNKEYIHEVEELTEEDKIEYEILLNLRLTSGINLERFKERYNVELKDKYNYDTLLKKNMLMLSNNHIYIPEDKLYVSNEIIVNLLQSKI